MTRRTVTKRNDDLPAGCAIAAILVWLVGLLLWASFWVLIVVVLWKLAHHL